MQLFNEITACKAKMVEYTAEINTLKEKLTAVQASQQAPASAVSPFLLLPCAWAWHSNGGSLSLSSVH